MDIRVLQYFLTVAREESITKAARVLHMTQPPLSRQLMDLEAELGKQLLVRGSKRVTLTEDGMLLRRRAEEIIELVEKTKTELDSSSENITGEVHIGGGETDAVSFFARAAKNLQKKHPLIRYRIYSGDAERVLERLDNGLIDFGLLIGPVDVVKYEYLRLPIKDRWGLLMPDDSPLAKKDTICAGDLTGLPLILSHQAAISSDMYAWLDTVPAKLNIVLRYDLIYNASRFVKEGLGYALALDRIINTSGQSGLCFRPLQPALEVNLSVVWKKGQIFSKAADAFLSELKLELNMQ